MAEETIRIVPRIKRRTPEEITAENLRRYMSAGERDAMDASDAVARTRQALTVGRLKIGRERD